MAIKSWDTLTRLTGGAPIEIERVRLVKQDIALEGPFELPPLVQLTADDQIFVIAFVRCHGSIKQMEKYFGVSYPTIKNRLNRIGAQLPFVEVEPEAEVPTATPGELLDQLDRGDLNVDDVLKQLKANRKGDR